MITNAILFPAGPFVEPEEILLDGHESIQRVIGGWFDAVSVNVPDPDPDTNPDGHRLVGYVHDTGMIDGLPFNYLATAMFGQNLFGPCLLVWATGPDGVVDGEDYDIPAWFTSYVSNTFLGNVADAYNMATTMTVMFGVAVEQGVITQGAYDGMMYVLEARARGEQVAEEVVQGAEAVSDTVWRWADEGLTNELVEDYIARNEGEFGEPQ